MAKRQTPERIDDIGEKIGGARKDSAVATGPRKSRPKVNDTDPRPAWMRRYVAMEQIDRATKTGTGKWSLVDMGRKDRYGGRVLMRDLPSESAAEKAVPMAAVARNHRVRGVENNQFEIWRDVTDRKRVKVTPERFASREDAMRFMAENAVKIIETKTGFGEEVLAKPERVYRTGEQWRHGAIDPQSFHKEFGFRGVEFGNWQHERQQVLNHAYDAMRDLAAVTGIAPDDLSLRRELGLAFGARGHGLSSARAHYEPKYGAINLTKLEGAGALAHEWWHSLDHMLGRTDDPKLAEREIKGGAKVFKQHSSDTVFASHRVDNPYAGKGQLPEPVRAAYKDLVTALYRKPEQYTEDKAKAERFVAGTANQLSEHIAGIRKNLTEHLTYGKRNVKPATAEQLARFDAAAARLQSGEAGKMEWRSFQTKPRPGNRFGGSSSRWTSPALEEISGVFKEVRGRTGFDSQHHHGPLDRLGAAMRNHESRQAMIKQAAAQSVKTRLVPTEYSMQARRLDEGRVGDYWQTKHEMTARAFSAYVEDRLAAAGRRSDYLSFGSDNKYYQMLGEKPFPEGAERQAINAKFDALFAAMRESGIVKPLPAGAASGLKGFQNEATLNAALSAQGKSAKGKAKAKTKQSAVSKSDAVFAAPHPTVARQADGTWSAVNAEGRVIVKNMPSESAVRQALSTPVSTTPSHKPFEHGASKAHAPGRQPDYTGEVGAKGKPTSKSRAQLLREAKAKGIEGAAAMETRALGKKLGYNMKYGLGLLAPVGIAAAAVMASNEARAEGKNTSGQIVAAGVEGAKAGGVMAGFMAAQTGVTYGLMKKVGMSAMKAVPAASVVMMAGNAAFEAVRAARSGNSVAGVAKAAARGAWDMSLPGMVVNTGIAVREAVQGLNAKATAPTAREQADSQYRSANVAYQALQASKPEDVRRGWANPKVQAAAQAALGRVYRGPQP